jgi:S1/P1 Nuclease
MRVSNSLVIATLSLTQQALCWGNLGHRTVAYLAQKYVTQDNAAFFDKVLDGEDWSDCAVWADEVKRQRPYSAEWHYIGSYALISHP